MLDDDDYIAVLQQSDIEPPAEDEDSMHEAIERIFESVAPISLTKTVPCTWPHMESDGVNSPNVTDELALSIHAVRVGSTTSARTCQLSLRLPPDSCDPAIGSNVPITDSLGIVVNASVTLFLGL